MNDWPAPTTLLEQITQQLHTGSGLTPHAETHDPKGGDPVLGGIRFLGSAHISTDYTNSTTTYTDIAIAGKTLSVTAHTHGGRILAVLTGSSYVRASTNNASASIIMTVDGTGLAVSNEMTLNIQATGATFVQTYRGAFAWMSAVTAAEILSGWFHKVNPGSHVFTLQGKVILGTNSEQLTVEAGSALLVFEILPSFQR